jgi:hypothetical protein
MSSRCERSNKPIRLFWNDQVSSQSGTSVYWKVKSRTWQYYLTFVLSNLVVDVRITLQRCIQKICTNLIKLPSSMTTHLRKTKQGKKLDWRRNFQKDSKPNKTILRLCDLDAGKQTVWALAYLAKTSVFVFVWMIDDIPTAQTNSVILNRNIYPGISKQNM